MADLGDVSLEKICFSEPRQTLASIRRSKRSSIFVSKGHQANETDILCAKSDHNNYGNREEDSCERRTTSNEWDIWGESATRHIEKHLGSLISHMSLLSIFIARDRSNVSFSLQLFEFDHFLAYKCMKLATLQASIYHSRKLVFDQFTDSCSVRPAIIFFQERACESMGWALLVFTSKSRRRRSRNGWKMLLSIKLLCKDK